MSIMTYEVSIKRVVSDANAAQKSREFKAIESVSDPAVEVAVLGRLMLEAVQQLAPDEYLRPCDVLVEMMQNFPEDPVEENAFMKIVRRLPRLLKLFNDGQFDDVSKRFEDVVTLRVATAEHE